MLMRDGRFHVPHEKSVVCGQHEEGISVTQTTTQTNDMKLVPQLGTLRLITRFIFESRSSSQTREAFAFVLKSLSALK